MDARSERIAADLKQSHSIALSPAWISTCVQALEAIAPDSGSWTHQRLLESVFAQALCTDLRTSGAACLPTTLPSMHKQLLEGRYVVQVDEVVNMAAPAKTRYTTTQERCLKFHLTDGHQHVFGIEYRMLPSAGWDCPAGCKFVIENVMVRRGVLLLQPENCVVLGGKVDALEAARLRSVAAWNKPAEGRSRHEGPRDIFTEARAAAWQLPEQPPAQPPQQQQVQPPQPPQQQQQQQPPQQQQPGYAQQQQYTLPQQQQQPLQYQPGAQQVPPTQLYPPPSSRPTTQPTQPDQHHQQQPVDLTWAAGSTGGGQAGHQLGGGGNRGLQSTPVYGAGVVGQVNATGAGNGYQSMNGIGTRPTVNGQLAFPRAAPVLGSTATVPTSISRHPQQQQQAGGGASGVTAGHVIASPAQQQQQQVLPYRPVHTHAAAAQQLQADSSFPAAALQQPSRQQQGVTPPQVTPGHSPLTGHTSLPTPHTFLDHPPSNQRLPQHDGLTAVGGWGGNAQQLQQPPQQFQSVGPGARGTRGTRDVGAAATGHDAIEDDDDDAGGGGSVVHPHGAVRHNREAAQGPVDVIGPPHVPPPAGSSRPAGYGGLHAPAPAPPAISPLQACENGLGGVPGAGLGMQQQQQGVNAGSYGGAAGQGKGPPGSLAGLMPVGAGTAAQGGRQPPPSLLRNVLGDRGNTGLVAARGYASYSSHQPPHQPPPGDARAQPWNSTLDVHSRQQSPTHHTAATTHVTATILQSVSARSGAASTTGPHMQAAHQQHVVQQQQARPAASVVSAAASSMPQLPVKRAAPLVIDLLSDDDEATNKRIHTTTTAPPPQQQQQHQQQYHQQLGPQPTPLPSAHADVIVSPHQRPQPPGDTTTTTTTRMAPPATSLPTYSQHIVPNSQCNPPMNSLPVLSALGTTAPVLQPDDEIWSTLPLMYICTLPAPQARGTGSSVLLLATIQSTDGRVATLEDGTGLLKVAISDQLFSTLLQGHHITDVINCAAAGDQIAMGLLGDAERLFRTFHGLMHVDMTGGSSQEQLGGAGTQGGRLPVLLALKELTQPQEWEDALSRQII